MNLSARHVGSHIKSNDAQDGNQWYEQRFEANQQFRCTTSRDKINWKNPWRLFSPWANRGPIGGLFMDPSWVPKFKENEIKEILTQNGLLDFFRAISLLITTFTTFLS